MSCPVKQANPNAYQKCKEFLGAKDDDDVKIFWLIAECKNCEFTVSD
jgi:hypothetical protein